MYRCRICSKEFTEIPPDAVEIAAKRRGTLYQFVDGEVHDLYRARSVSADHRWHRNPRWDCIFCFPKPAPPIITNPEPPVVHTELVQEVQAPVPEQNLPVAEQTVLEKLPEPEIEDELTAITTLAHAFSRVNRK